MSEVRMSLQEYNEVKEKLDRYERIMNAITTPNPISQWDIHWHKSHPENTIGVSSLPLDNLSREDKDYLKSLIYRQASVLAEEQFVLNDMAMMFETELSIHLGYFKNIEEPKKGEEE